MMTKILTMESATALLKSLGWWVEIDEKRRAFGTLLFSGLRSALFSLMRKK
ncbi:hypothetical protein [Bartonella florencae]|uniref:hypothetical protein n=1 Tax=Bartonella florencae TaxID=928210 RepID=UPI0012E9E279|nr:hypothetical protein [Bartonella florencae]